MIPHHPTTAELAAFRLDIAATISPGDLPDSLRSAFVPAGAWPDERRTGMGYHPSYGLAHNDSALQGFARREASAMRSRAFVGPESMWPALATFAPR